MVRSGLKSDLKLDFNFLDQITPFTKINQDAYTGVYINITNLISLLVEEKANCGMSLID